MIQQQTTTWSDGQQEYEGVIAFDDSISGQRPLILVSHAWMGQSDFENNKAVELAKLGYLGFAIDVYGKGRRASDVEGATALMGEMDGNRTVLLERLQLALETGKGHELADTTKIGAIGFCFGGKCVLDIARSGANISGVVSFHGIFDQPGIVHEGDIKAKVLVLHGWDDPLATPEAVVGLAKELTHRNTVWELDAYGHTGHAFTNPQADAPDQGMFFKQIASDRAWQRMVNFFQELF